MKVLVLEPAGIPASDTGSGTRVIRWGLAKGLIELIDGGHWVWITPKASADIESALIQSAEKLEKLGWTTTISLGTPRAESEQVLRDAIAVQKPDVALVYGEKAAKMFRPFAKDIPYGIISIDLWHLPRLYRAVFGLSHGSLMEQLRTLKDVPRFIRESANSYFGVKDTYASASFAINHAAMHADWLRRQTGLPTLYTPNPVAYSPPPQSWPSQDGVAMFALLGGMGGIATLTGLGFLARRVLPHLEPALKRGEMTIYNIGKGDIPAKIGQAFDNAGIVQLGFVEELDPVLAKARALLVPTPIRLGFRTRILDCFRQGVCVIAHSANAAGMPELVHDRNALLADDGKQFAEQILRLKNEPETAIRLAKQARKDFEDSLSAEKSCGKIHRFISDVIKLP